MFFDIWSTAGYMSLMLIAISKSAGRENSNGLNTRSIQLNFDHAWTRHFHGEEDHLQLFLLLQI